MRYAELEPKFTPEQLDRLFDMGYITSETGYEETNDFWLYLEVFQDKFGREDLEFLLSLTPHKVEIEQSEDANRPYKIYLQLDVGEDTKEGTE